MYGAWNSETLDGGLYLLMEGESMYAFSLDCWRCSFSRAFMTSLLLLSAVHCLDFWLLLLLVEEELLSQRGNLLKSSESSLWEPALLSFWWPPLSLFFIKFFNEFFVLGSLSDFAEESCLLEISSREGLYSSLLTGGEKHCGGDTHCGGEFLSDDFEDTELAYVGDEALLANSDSSWIQSNMSKSVSSASSYRSVWF